jgi:hypothetical protein
MFIHKRLASEGKKYDIPGRKEWFNSSLTEVHSLWLDFKKFEEKKPGSLQMKTSILGNSE